MPISIDLNKQKLDMKSYIYDKNLVGFVKENQKPNSEIV